MFKYRHFFFIPGFYLLVTFSVAYMLYCVGIIKWEQPPAELHYWCILTLLAAMLSVLVHARSYNSYLNAANTNNDTKKAYLDNKLKWVLWIGITALGMLGVVKYVLDYANYLGAFGIFFAIFTEDTGQLRSMADNVESVGTQLSYFTWLSSFILVCEIASGNIRKRWFLVVIIIVLLNSIFLDRTRPVWIIFTCALCYFFMRYNLYSRKKIASVIILLTVFFISVFMAIGAILGKGADDENYLSFGLPKWVQPVFLYLTSSFAYLGRLISMDMPYDYSPERIGYPAAKILAKAGVMEQPPSQILEFFSVPLLTNVGTFLEPFLQDGGVLFLVFGIFIHTFVFDWLALLLIQKKSIFAVIALATLCFINFIAFFVPKISSTATWFIFLFCFLLSYTYKWSFKSG